MTSLRRVFTLPPDNLRDYYAKPRVARQTEEFIGKKQVREEQ
jgi:hypothetical protein